MHRTCLSTHFYKESARSPLHEFCRSEHIPLQGPKFVVLFGDCVSVDLMLIIDLSALIRRHLAAGTLKIQNFSTVVR